MSPLLPEVTLLCAKFDLSTPCTFCGSSATQQLTIASCSFPEFDTRCSSSLSTLCGSSPGRFVDHRTSLQPEDQILPDFLFLLHTHAPHWAPIVTQVLFHAVRRVFYKCREIKKINNLIFQSLY